MNYRWFISRKVRHATHMWKHVRNMLNAQRDILSPQAIENVTTSVAELKAATRADIPKAELEKQMTKLEEAANKWLKPYPHANYRENIEVFLVALAVAMGIRTFFVQPFKIPTGSMQPALYGVTSTPDYTTCYHYSRPEDRARCRAVVHEEITPRASGRAVGIGAGAGLVCGHQLSGRESESRWHLGSRQRAGGHPHF
jgi:hypothetical protein